MPATFVKGKKNEELWEKAKKIVEKQYKDIDKESDQYWALVTGVYKQSGGKIANAQENSNVKIRRVVEALFNSRKKSLNEAKIGNYDVPYGLNTIIKIEKDLNYKRIKVGTYWKITDYDGGSGDYVLTQVNITTGKELAGKPWYQGNSYISKWEKEGMISIAKNTDVKTKRDVTEGIYDNNNLADANSYYTITYPVSMYIPSGAKIANPYMGNTNMFEVEYQRILPQVGDEIHNLINGTFYISQTGKNLIPVLPEIPHDTPLRSKEEIRVKFDMRGLQKIEKSRILV
jgi:hypothetical protein